MSPSLSNETCLRGCCEWAEDGEVIRYAPHGQPCDFCGDFVDGDGPDRISASHGVVCSEKCAGKTVPPWEW